MKALATGILSVCILFMFTGASVAQDAGYIPGAGSKSLLEAAANQAPDNYAVAYHLGRIYANEGDRQAAIEQWARYLAAAPADSRTAAVGERLTVLKMQQAAEDAKKAVSGKTPDAGRLDENTVAVLNFDFSNLPELSVLSKGVTAMIITDLSKVSDLTVVERIKMQALLREIRLGQTGAIDEDTAMKTGRLLLARHIVRGGVSKAEKETLKLASTVSETAGGTDLGAAEAKGDLDRIFDMEKEVVFGILDALGVQTENLPEDVAKAVKARHTNSVDALMSFSRGLDFQDQEMFTQAREAFQQAVDMDPGFDMAADALSRAPSDAAAVDPVSQIETLEYEETGGEAETGTGGTDSAAVTAVSVTSTEEIVEIAQEDNAIEAGGDQDHGSLTVEW